MNTKSTAEILDELEAVLNIAADLSEALGPAAFEDEDSYWTVRRAISEAGGIVAAAVV